MISNFDLNTALAELEARSATQPGTDTRGGRWARMALAAEQLAGASSSANDNINGYMLRTAVALEAISGGNGDAENRTREGLLQRIVDALEVKAGQVYTGSLGQRLRQSAAAAVLFTPASLASLAAWHDADQQTEGEGIAVSSFVDRSGNGKHWAGPVGNEPVNDHNAINGRKALFFNRTLSHHMTQADLLSGATAGSFFVVMQLEAGYAAREAPLLNRFPRIDSYLTYFNGLIYEGFGTTARKDAIDPAVNLATPHVYSAHTGPGDYRVYLDGAPIYSTAANAVDFNTTGGTRLLGCISPGVNHWGGWVAEMIFTNSALTTPQRQNVERYLARKFGLTVA